MKNHRATRLNLPAILLAMFGIIVSLPASPADIYFPDDDRDWETIDPASAGWNPELLDAALDVAGTRNSSGVLILLNGRIMAERYWEMPDTSAYRNYLQGYDDAGRAIEDVASAQKSVVAILTGIAQERGLLKLDDTVTQYLGAGWSKAAAAQEQKITIRHLLSMSSGLGTDFSFESDPGTRWLYNTPVYHLTMRVLMAATGMDRNQITDEWLTAPLGLSHTSWTARPWADPEIGVGLSTTARELARFGLMIQAGGKWNDQVIIADTGFLDAMLSPSQDMNPAYGYLWWLNGQEYRTNAGTQRAQLIPEAPEDLVAMQGAGDRKLYIVPSLGLVITRLGFNGGGAEGEFNEVFWAALMQAAPR